MSWTEIILHYAVPTAGVITANLMSSAAFRDVQKAILSSQMGSLNPTPWAFMMGNCLGWVAYSFMAHNVFLFLSNAPGFFLSVWLNMAAIKLQFENHRSSHMQQYIVEGLTKRLDSPKIADMAARRQYPYGTTNDDEEKRAESWCSEEEREEQQQQEEKEGWRMVFHDFDRIVSSIASEKKPAPAPHERLVLYIVILWTCVMTVLAFGKFSGRTREQCVGYVVNLNLIFLYAAPLTEVMAVVRNQSSATIHVPTTLCNSSNSILWTIYGAALNNYFILVPNAIGTLLGLFQMGLTLWYPADYEVVPNLEPGWELGSQEKK